MKIRVEQIRGDSDISNPKVLMSANGSAYWGDAPGTPIPDPEATPTIKTGEFPSGFGSVAYWTRMGNIVQITLGGISNSTPSNAMVNLGERIPEHLRPHGEARIPFRMMTSGRGNGAGVLMMYPDGRMKLHTTTPEQSELLGTATYITNAPDIE